MPNLSTFKIDRKVLFCCLAVLGTGFFLGSAATTAVLLPRLYDAQTVSRSLEAISTLQSSRIADLSVSKAIALPGVFQARTQPLPPGAGSLAGTPMEVKSNGPLASAAATTVAEGSVAVLTASPSTPRAAVRAVTRQAPPVQPVRPVAQVAVAAPPGLSPSAVAALASRKGATVAATPLASPAREPAPAVPSVTLEQAGITSIDNTSVRFTSGRQVLVGTEFPSGEKLISISPVEGRIVTDRRVIMLTKPQQEK